MTRTATVILNWNGIVDTLLSVRSIAGQTIKTTIVVVDNGSQDDSVAILQKEFPDIVILAQQKNLGFAGGVNVGIHYAVENDFEYVALFNNDAVADKNWLKHLLAAMHGDKRIGITTGLLLDKTGNRIDSTGEFYSVWGLSFPRSRDDATKHAPQAGNVFGASGGASLYNVALFKDIGLFDEDFFAYYEDVDISFRAQLAGWSVVYTPSAKAYHNRGATSSKLPGFAVYQTFKNLPMLYVKNVPRQLLIPVGIRFSFIYTLMLLKAVFSKNVLSALKGAVMGCLLWFRKLPNRHTIQSSRRVTTQHINAILWHDLPPQQKGARALRKLFTGKP